LSGDAPSRQRRGRRIEMSAAERDDFLARAKVCRLASVGRMGPHVTPLWFAWHQGALWLYSLTRSQRWADLMTDPRAAAVIDAGDEYSELRGVELRGSVEAIGEVPRTGAEFLPELATVERLYARKYSGGVAMTHDRRHAWLRLTPTNIVSWDFRKLT
jgi:hypothetical protein